MKCGRQPIVTALYRGDILASDTEFFSAYTGLRQNDKGDKKPEPWEPAIFGDNLRKCAACGFEVGPRVQKCPGCGSLQSS